MGGPDKIIWGSDYAGFRVQIKSAVEGLSYLQIPEDMQDAYGFLPITDEDRAKIWR